jgi:SAM-dependent methyltransferase
MDLCLMLPRDQRIIGSGTGFEKVECVMPQSFDAETQQFYEGDITAYAAQSMRLTPWGQIDAFMKKLPIGGTILDLGCGAGRDSRMFLEKGFAVTAVDGSSAMAREAERNLGTPVGVMEFSAMPWVAAFDGIWASASLLHVPRPALGTILGLVHRALKPGGLHYASYKAGEKDGRDGLGRYYNYVDADFLRETYEASGDWQDLLIMERDGSSYDGVPTRWLHVFTNRG